MLTHDQIVLSYVRVYRHFEQKQSTDEIARTFGFNSECETILHSPNIKPSSFYYTEVYRCTRLNTKCSYKQVD